MIRVVISGGFDPIHAGHIDHIRKAAALGGQLTVITCPDEVLIQKKGYCLIPLADRKAILLAIECVDAIIVGAYEGTSCWPTLLRLKADIFAKGGDRTSDNMDQREIEACAEVGTEIRYGVGDLLNSSADLVERLLVARHCGG